MQCPIDQTPLVMAGVKELKSITAQSAKIAVDHQELDKIIRRLPAAIWTRQQPPPRRQTAGKPRVVIVDRDIGSYRRYRDPNSPTYNPQYRKKVAQGEVFDVFD
ncbi:MAG: hypothetical protein U0670_12040 [Anaerolineae bacterium]